jgi:hypothetical protein
MGAFSTEDHDDRPGGTPHERRDALLPRRRPALCRHHCPARLIHRPCWLDVQGRGVRQGVHRRTAVRARPVHPQPPGAAPARGRRPSGRRPPVHPAPAPRGGRDDRWGEHHLVHVAGAGTAYPGLPPGARLSGTGSRPGSGGAGPSLPAGGRGAAERRRLPVGTELPPQYEMLLTHLDPNRASSSTGASTSWPGTAAASCSTAA